MKKVTLDEIVGLERYELEREAFRRRIIDLKRRRRVGVGDRVSFVFENHDTMLFQIQEMLRAERIADVDRIRAEIDVYNALVPAAGELSATMLIEITEAQQIRDELVKLIGVDEHVRLEIGSQVVPGQFEPGRSTADKLSAVQYVRFAFDPAARAAFIAGTEAVRLVIDHPNYAASTVLDPEVRQALRVDLESP